MVTAKGDARVTSFKVVGLIAGIVSILAVFIGGTMWVSMNIANNAVAIGSLAETQTRHEARIDKNAEVLHQHERLLAAIEEHSRQIKAFSDFMYKGDRFTMADGNRHENRIIAIEEWINEAPPVWFREMFREFKAASERRFEVIEKSLKEQQSSLNIIKYELRRQKDNGPAFERERH